MLGLAILCETGLEYHRCGGKEYMRWRSEACPLVRKVYKKERGGDGGGDPLVRKVVGAFVLAALRLVGHH